MLQVDAKVIWRKRWFEDVWPITATAEGKRG
jgi:hypothetical protein